MAIDGLRGLAILLVTVFHYSYQFFHETTLYGMTVVVVDAGRSLWFGVGRIFVLSGFLITGILCRTRNCGDCFQRFFCSRAVRISPLYFASYSCCAFRWLACMSLLPIRSCRKISVVLGVSQQFLLRGKETSERRPSDTIALY